MLFCTVIENIAIAYHEDVLAAGALPDIIRVFIGISGQLFVADDTFVLTNANFFETTFSELCKSVEVLDGLWSVCSGISGSLPGSFIFTCCLSATFSNLPEFYLDRLDPITRLLCAALSGPSRLLSEAAARAAQQFIEQYGTESEFTPHLAASVLDSCIAHTSDDLLLVLAAVLNLTRDSEELFDRAFPFLVDVVACGCTLFQEAALTALGALAAGSTIKITLHFDTLLQLIGAILDCPHATPLFGPAVECLSHALIGVGGLFEPHVPSFSRLCLASVAGDSPSITASCLIALEAVSEFHVRAFAPFVAAALPLVCDLASTDPSAASRTLVCAALASGSGAADLDDSPFFACAAALRVLSVLLKTHRDLCPQYATHIVHCCEIQRVSTAPVCRAAAAAAVGNLAEAIVSARQPLTIERMGHVLLGVLFEAGAPDAELLGGVFDAAAKVVEWLDYDALGSAMKPLLDDAHARLVRAAESRARPWFVRDVVESIVRLLAMIAQSAEDRVEGLLRQFLSLFVDFTTHPDPWFRSLALRFFGAVLAAAPDVLAPEFRADVCALALATAEETGDRYAFAVLRTAAVKEPALAAQFADGVLRLCLEMFARPLAKSLRFLGTRDACSLTFCAFAVHVFGDALPRDDCLPLALAALPLVLDFSEVSIMVDFFRWVNARAAGGEALARALVVLFATAPSVIAKTQIGEAETVELMQMLRGLLRSMENPEAFVLQALNGDETLKLYLDRWLEGEGQ
jgi:hypothetical protein